jgi:uncharacterized membrane protein YdcZ (DUF606 family)
MPHLLIDRIRANIFITRKHYPVLAYAVEVLDILAAFLFIIGSFCFLPPYSHDMPVFLAGCIIYVVGSLFYFIVCLFTAAEAYIEKGSRSWEFYENTLYVLGSWIFFIGTFFYWPEKAMTDPIHLIQQCSLAQYYNMVSPEFEGTIMFIVGSVFFAMAAFINALSQRTADDLASRLLTLCTTMYMLGSILFVVGSVLFLPNVGCGMLMVKIGAWSFIVASGLFFVGSVLSLYRTHHMLTSKGGEASPLIDNPRPVK